jgi:sugar phosphate isomerase/epimerase
MTGLTSITFRQLDVEQIIALAKTAGVDGIEWGGDIHVPPNETGPWVREKTAEAGLAVLSYGSYFRLCAGGDFAPVLAAAASLGAPLIRVWAGDRGSAAAEDDYYRRAAEDLRDICSRSADQGIKIGLEYHRKTLTDTAESAEKLLSLANMKNLSVYWQPNPDLPLSDHGREIRRLLPWISQIHVFYWKPGNVRCPLAEGVEAWREYIGLLGRDRNYIVEFVLEDRAEQFLADAETLRTLLRKGDL